MPLPGPESRLVLETAGRPATRLAAADGHHRLPRFAARAAPGCRLTWPDSSTAARPRWYSPSARRSLDAGRFYETSRRRHERWAIGRCSSGRGAGPTRRRPRDDHPRLRPVCGTLPRAPSSSTTAASARPVWRCGRVGRCWSCRGRGTNRTTPHALRDWYRSRRPPASLHGGSCCLRAASSPGWRLPATSPGGERPARAGRRCACSL